MNSTQVIIDKKVPIWDYVNEHSYVFLVVNHLIYRLKTKKIGGNRVLSVQIEWHVESDVLKADIEFNSTLTKSYKEMKRIAEQCLKKMNKRMQHKLMMMKLAV